MATNPIMQITHIKLWSFGNAKELGRLTSIETSVGLYCNQVSLLHILYILCFSSCCSNKTTFLTKDLVFWCYHWQISHNHLNESLGCFSECVTCQTNCTRSAFLRSLATSKTHCGQLTTDLLLPAGPTVSYMIQKYKILPKHFFSKNLLFSFPKYSYNTILRVEKNLFALEIIPGSAGLITSDYNSSLMTSRDGYRSIGTGRNR